VRGTTVERVTTTADQAYRHLIGLLSGRATSYPAILQYWSVARPSYSTSTEGVLQPQTLTNPASVWAQPLSNGGYVAPPVDNADNQYRALTSHRPPSTEFTSGGLPFPVPRLVGSFDPKRLDQSRTLTQVPLGPYQPISAAPEDPASRRALGGGDLGPNLNLGGYLSQPVQMVTTLAALPALENAQAFGAQVPTADPISAIRVRVKGVHGSDPLSLERVKAVAQGIAVGSGLTVDIVAGSSPSPTTVALPAGQHGQPALRISEPWVRKGVVVSILSAVDRTSVVLFFLILLVCGLFEANAALAAVRRRRIELAILTAMGWTRARLFALVLGQLGVVGAVAGVLGAAVAVPVAGALGLHVSSGRAVVAVPSAVVLALLAGLGPAWLATRAQPIDALRPPAVATRRARIPRGVGGLAMTNVLRTPGRTALSATGLAIGVAALTVLAAVTFAYHGTLVGSLLGSAIEVRIRGVDYVAAAATVLLSVVAVADAWYLTVQERAAELATLRALGWSERSVARLVVTEGVVLGIAGAVVGVIIGLAGAALLAHQLPGRVWAVAAAVGVGAVALAALAALVPTLAVSRVPTNSLLAEE
jgi:putative ABC transport system permease protein